MREVFGDRGGFIALVGNNDAADLRPALSCDIGTHVCTKPLSIPLWGELMPEVRLTDHSYFWDAGYNIMMMADTSFVPTPNYH
jgi:hypothetical protein